MRHLRSAGTFTNETLANTTRAAGLAAAMLAAIDCAPPAAAQDDGEPAAPAHSFRPLAEESVSPSSVLTATEIRMAPGAPTRSHRHPGSVFVYVVEGSVRSALNDEPAVLYNAGDTWFEPEGATHTLVETAGDEPALLLVVMVAPKDATTTADDE